MDKRSGLETLTIPHVCISSDAFLTTTDCSVAGIRAPSQCIDIEWPDMTVSIIVNVCPQPTEKCFITFTGGQPPDNYGTFAKRHFNRLTWKPNTAHVICVSDPIHFTSFINRIGFYAIDIFGPQNIPPILSHLLRLLNVTDVCLLGSSGGAWVTLKYLSEKLLPGVRKGLYMCGQINPMLSRLNGVCKEIMEIIGKEVNWEINLSALSDCQVLCVQNELDTHYFETQIKFYSEQMIKNNIKLYLFNTPSSIDTDNHHGYGLSQKIVQCLIHILNNEAITDPSKLEELERHQFRLYNDVHQSTNYLY